MLLSPFPFCVGFPHTLSGVAIFFSLIICIQEPSLYDLVCIRKREDPGIECLCVVAITRLGVLSVGELFRLVFSLQLVYFFSSNVSLLY